MALLFIDSFDHYGNTNNPIQRKWTGSINTFGSIDTTDGRTGNCLNFGGGGPWKTLAGGTGLNGSYSAMTGGYAYWTQNFGNSPILLKYVSASNEYQIFLQHVGDGRLYVADNGSPSNSSSYSTFVMSTNTWYFLEFHASYSSTPSVSISYEARANGATILSGSFTAGIPAWMPGFNNFGIGAPGGGYHALADDLYVTDGEFLGDVRIYCLYPRADGTLSQWVPSAAGSHYLMVNEHQVDDLATYVSSDNSPIGKEDDYYLDAITATTGSIKGAQAVWSVEKSDAGAATIQGIWNSGGTVQAVPSAGYNPSAVGWTMLLDPHRQSPFTSSDWTFTEINGLQLGIKRTV